jgi:hypothetical protein
MRWHRSWLCVAPVTLFLIDISLTLWGQPAEYWAGEYRRALEGSPEVRRVMRIHPVLLYVMICVWIAVIVVLVQILPRLLAEFFAASVTIGHATCGSTWIPRLFTNSYQLRIALAILAGCLLIMSVNASRAVSEKPWRWRHGRAGVLVVLFLLSVIAYAALYPH